MLLEPSILDYWDDALTKWAIWPGRPFSTMILHIYVTLTSLIPFIGIQENYFPVIWKEMESDLGWKWQPVSQFVKRMMATTKSPQAHSSPSKESTQSQKSALHNNSLDYEASHQRFRQFCYQEVAGPHEAFSTLWELYWQWLRPKTLKRENPTAADFGAVSHNLAGGAPDLCEETASRKWGSCSSGWGCTEGTWATGEKRKPEPCGSDYKKLGWGAQVSTY